MSKQQDLGPSFLTPAHHYSQDQALALRPADLQHVASVQEPKPIGCGFGAEAVAGEVAEILHFVLGSSGLTKREQ